ncbi:MAG: hypothetical protein ACYC49_00320 [Ignavibacteriaceae bacterium]
MKILLIGHSGSGKTDCRRYLNIPENAEMDLGLGTLMAPSYQETIDWVSANESSIVVISVHKDTLKELNNKKEKNNNEVFKNLIFVYLHKSKSKLADHLQLDVTNGKRKKSNLCDTLNSYEEMDQIFSKLSDVKIVTTDISISMVAERVISLLKIHEK